MRTHTYSRHCHTSGRPVSFYLHDYRVWFSCEARHLNLLWAQTWAYLPSVKTGMVIQRITQITVHSWLSVGGFCVDVSLCLGICAFVFSWKSYPALPLNIFCTQRRLGQDNSVYVWSQKDKNDTLFGNCMPQFHNISPSHYYFFTFPPLFLNIPFWNEITCGCLNYWFPSFGFPLHKCRKWLGCFLETKDIFFLLSKNK